MDLNGINNAPDTVMHFGTFDERGNKIFPRCFAHHADGLLRPSRSFHGLQMPCVFPFLSL